MHKLLDLARRVEEAEGPSRELDAEIWSAANSGYIEQGNIPGFLNCSVWCDDKGWVKHAASLGDGMVRERKFLGRASAAPAYSGSLDSAAALVPGKWRIYSADFSVEGRFAWTLKGPFAPDDDDELFVVFEWGNAATPALALTAAALRARAALEQADEL